MEKVTGIGGIFVKANNPEELQKWYQANLGIPVDEGGYSIFSWRDADHPEKTGETVWSLMPQETPYLEPSRASWMINYRVEDLDLMLAQLRAANVTVVEVGEVVEEYGRFAWIIDPEGNKIELWEPPKTA